MASHFLEPQRQPTLDPPNTEQVDAREGKRLVLTDRRFRRAQRIHAFILTAGSMAGTMALIFFSMSYGISALDVSLFAGMYLATMTCMSIGFHRGYAHRSYDAPAAVRFVIAAIGSMSAQGPLIYWTANHRRHHWDSDGPADPHSPHQRGGNPIRGLEGFWHSHIGWMFSHEPTNTVYFARSLLTDPIARLVNRTYLWWVALGLLLPTTIGGLVSGRWEGALGGFLWGGPFRILAVLQVTCLITSATHLFGQRRYETNESSHNIWWLALPTLGEAWHNNHHASPRSAAFAHAWWQFDFGWYVIWLLGKCGLATHIRTPRKGRNRQAVRRSGASGHASRMASDAPADAG